jgi:hypothetical protein
MTIRMITNFSAFIAFLYKTYPTITIKQETVIIPPNAIHAFPGLGITSVEVGTIKEKNEKCGFGIGNGQLIQPSIVI